MRNYDILEHDIVILFQFNSDYWPLIANDIDLLLNISLLHDDTWLLDRLVAGVDTFN